eukprot:CFRG1829T1
MFIPINSKRSSTHRKKSVNSLTPIPNVIYYFVNIIHIPSGAFSLEITPFELPSAIMLSTRLIGLALAAISGNFGIVYAGDPQNVLYMCGAQYATLFDTAFTASGEATCNEAYIPMPEGWEIVPADDINVPFILGKESFGVENLILGDGHAYRHGDATLAKVNAMHEQANAYKVVSCATSTAVLIRKVTAAPTETEYTIRMKTLIISTSEDVHKSIVNIYQGFGAPYTLINLYEQTFPDLVDKDGPLYNAIALTSVDLMKASTIEGEYYPALTSDEWSKLYEYAEKYNVRVVTLHSNQNADQALIGIGAGNSEATTLIWLNNPMTLSLNDSVPLTARLTLSEGESWVYPTKLSSNTRHLLPFLMFENDGSVGAFVKKCINREEMHFTFAPNQYYNSTYVLGDVWFHWVNKGVYIGERRALLSAQVDDVFLATEYYNVELGRQAYDGEAKHRSNASDMIHLRDFQTQLNIENSEWDIRYEMAINGQGWSEFEYFTEDSQLPRDNMNDNLLEYRDHFFWVTHTWSHMDLYCIDSKCLQYGYTPYNTSFEELKLNVEFAQYVLFPSVKADDGTVKTRVVDLGTIWNWSPESIVTPRISGLNRSESIQAMLDFGIKTAIGDNTRQDLQAPNPFHSFLTKTGGTTDASKKMNVIPRYATRVYFDVSFPEESVEEFNSFYGPNCFGWNETGPIVFKGRKCNVTSFKYDRKITLNEIMDIEGASTALNLFKKRPDPYMFHQANMKAFWWEGKKQSLLTLWTSHVIKSYKKYSNLPILTLKMDDLRKYYDAREARDSCGIDVRQTYAKNADNVSLRVRTTGECGVKITRSTGASIQLQATSGRRASDVTSYGFDETLTVDSPSGGGDQTVAASICQDRCDPYPEKRGAQPVEDEEYTVPDEQLTPMIDDSTPSVDPVPPSNDFNPNGSPYPHILEDQGDQDSGSVPTWAIATAVVCALFVALVLIAAIIVWKRRRAQNAKIAAKQLAVNRYSTAKPSVSSC